MNISQLQMKKRNMWTFLLSIIWHLIIKSDLVVCSVPNIGSSTQKNWNEYSQRHMSRRHLQSGIPYKVNLFLSLDYVNDTVAMQFETSQIIPSTNATAHFCYAVNKQVRYHLEKIKTHSPFDPYTCP
jgi:hypothetical protein